MPRTWEHETDCGQESRPGIQRGFLHFRSRGTLCSTPRYLIISFITFPSSFQRPPECLRIAQPAFRRRRRSRNPNSFSAPLLLFVANDAAIYRTLFNDERQNSIESDGCGSEVGCRGKIARYQHRYHHKKRGQKVKI